MSGPTHRKWAAGDEGTLARLRQSLDGNTEAAQALFWNWNLENKKINCISSISRLSISSKAYGHLTRSA